MQLRVYNPDDNRDVTAASPLDTFFERWYTAAVNSNKKRKPVSQATIDRRRAAVAWWTKLMGSIQYPAGPAIGDITDELLATFAERLTTATFRRSKFSAKQYPLSAVTQIRTLEEVQIVLAAAGPAVGRNKVRAGLLAESPSIYVPEPECFPKPTWPLDQAIAICKAIRTANVPDYCPADQFYALAEATIALWFYTGHRATTYQRLNWNCLIERQPGEWYLQIRSVKTGKMDRVAVHPALLAKLQRLRGMDEQLMIPWPVCYSAIVRQHSIFQRIAGIPQAYTPQAWRRLHGDQITRVGYRLAQALSKDALGHSSAAITESHYSSARDAAILLLPDLFQHSSGQLELF